MTSEAKGTTLMNSADDDVLLRVQGLKKYFPIKKGLLRRTVGLVRAVDDVSFTIKKGETLSLVGESGCGKTTTARCVVRAMKPTEGQIEYTSENNSTVDLAGLSMRKLKPIRHDIQMIFQDPFASLNPRMNIAEIVGEPLYNFGMKSRKDREEKIADLLQLVGLRPEYMQRYPHAFSGGQRQRIGIARALALNPRLVVADEAVSALDVSVQAQVLNLMTDLREKLGLAYLFVAHDLSVVRQFSHRVAVMYVGKIVEVAPTEELFKNPQHPYTAALISAVPVADPRLRQDKNLLEGDVADPANPPTGCNFHPRCPHATEICRTEQPSLQNKRPGQLAACHHSEKLNLTGVSQFSATAGK
jgi:peptide/nickel transport system ATP-binding protein